MESIRESCNNLLGSFNLNPHCDLLHKRAVNLREQLNWFPCELQPSTHPCARDGHTAVTVASNIVIFGGHNGQVALDDCWTLDMGLYSIYATAVCAILMTFYLLS